MKKIMRRCLVGLTLTFGIGGMPDDWMSVGRTAARPNRWEVVTDTGKFITGLALDQSGTVWVTSEDAGVTAIDRNGSAKRYSAKRPWTR